jgi:hypothetical protein
MRLNLGGAGPFETYFSTYNEVKSLQGLYQRATAAAQLYGLSTTNVVMDSLAAHPELANMLNSYDHKRLDMRIKMDAELAFHGFGGALWVDGSIAPYLDRGIILPYMAIDTFYVDGVEDGSTETDVSAVPTFILVSTEVRGYRFEDHKAIPEAYEAMDDDFVVDYVRVFDRIDQAEIWIPDYEIEHRYKSKKKRFESRLAGENVPQHIYEMESILGRALQKMDDLERKISEFEAFQTQIRRLEAYYTGPQWKEFRIVFCNIKYLLCRLPHIVGRKDFLAVYIFP